MKLIAIPAVLASCLGVGWAVYHDSVSDAVENLPEQWRERVAVEVTSPGTQDVFDELELVGGLEADRDVEIRSRLGGLIIGLPVDIGDEVEAGDVVVQLDRALHRQLVLKAEAALEVARADQRTQQVRVNTASRERDRVERLAKQEVATSQQREAAAAAVAIAEAELKLRDAMVTQAESERDRAGVELSELTIAAPLTGRVAERMVEPGDLVAAGDPILRLVDLSRVRTTVHVGEKDYERIRIGQQAWLGVDTFPGVQFDGRVERKAPVLDPRTRTAAVQIAVANADSRLKPGMHARVRLQLGCSSDAMVVPLAAIIDVVDGHRLFVVSGNPPVARIRSVEIGLSDGRFVEIRPARLAADQLRPDDRVVTLGSHLVDDGQEVEVVDDGASRPTRSQRSAPNP